MIELGRLCVKTAGRDAMRHCVIIEVIDEKYVLIDGNTRRKKVNKAHLEPLEQVFKVKKGASTKEILELFEKEGIEVKKTEKTNLKKTSEKPKRVKTSQKKGQEKKEKKSTEKKKKE